MYFRLPKDKSWRKQRLTTLKIPITAVKFICLEHFTNEDFPGNTVITVLISS